jgi:hypothetical protein
MDLACAWFIDLASLYRCVGVLRKVSSFVLGGQRVCIHSDLWRSRFVLLHDAGGLASNSTPAHDHSLEQYHCLGRRWSGSVSLVWLFGPRCRAMKSRSPHHALQRIRRERRGCNGFARARSLSPAGLRPKAEFLSPFPKRLKCCVPSVLRSSTATEDGCAGSLSYWVVRP